MCSELVLQYSLRRRVFNAAVFLFAVYLDKDQAAPPVVTPGSEDAEFPGKTPDIPTPSGKPPEETPALFSLPVKVSAFFCAWGWSTSATLRFSLDGGRAGGGRRCGFTCAERCASQSLRWGKSLSADEQDAGMIAARHRRKIFGVIIY